MKQRILRLFFFALLLPLFAFAGEIKMTSVGTNHVLAISADSSLWTWGANTFGQLGNSSFGDANYPVRIGTDKWIHVSAGTNVSYGIKSDNTLWAWGKNDKYQFGSNVVALSNVPIQIGNAEWNSVFSGWGRVFAIKSDWTLWTWGESSYRAFGTGKETQITKPKQVGTDYWRSIALSEKTTYGIQLNWSLWAWGSNENGLLGDPSFSASESNVPIHIVPGYHPTKVVAGKNVAAALVDRRIMAWGNNQYGQLGDVAPSWQDPVIISGDEYWTDLAVSDTTMLGVNLGSQVIEWGGSLSNTSFIYGKGGWINVYSNGESEFITSNNGLVYSKGANPNGILGAGNSLKRDEFSLIYKSKPYPFPNPDKTLRVTSLQSTVVPIEKYLQNFFSDTIVSVQVLNKPKLAKVSLQGKEVSLSTYDFVTGFDTLQLKIKDAWENVVDVQVPFWVNPDKATGIKVQKIAANFYQTGFISQDSLLWFTGYNQSGVFGTGDRDSRFRPVLSNDKKWKMLAMSQYHTMAIDVDGSLWSWGMGQAGLLGTPEDRDVYVPTQVGSDKWKSVDCSEMTCFGIQENGSLWIWGIYGNAKHSMVQLSSARWLQVSSGTEYGLAIREDNTLWAWGKNTAGELGLGDSVYRETLQQVGSSKWIQVEAGSQWSLGIQEDGTLWTWGTNGSFVVNDSIAPSSIPILLMSGSWKKLASHGRLAAAINEDNKLYTWGSDGYGALGDGQIVHRVKPSIISDDDWIDVAIGDNHMVAMRCDSIIFTWGKGYNGELGTGSTWSHTDPQPIPALNDAPERLEFGDTILVADEDFGVATISMENWFVDPNGDPLQIMAYSHYPALKDVSITDSILSIQSGQDWFGSVEIGFVATDGKGGFSILNKTVIVNPVNDAPVITNVNPSETMEDISIFLRNVVDVYDPEGSVKIIPTSFEYVDRIENNWLTLKQDYNGRLKLSLYAEDGSGARSDTVEVELKVLPVNDPPRLIHPKPLFVLEDDSLKITDKSFTVYDPDGDSVYWEVESGLNYSFEDGTIHPYENWNGVTKIPIMLSDGKDSVESFDLSLGVIPVNDVPIIDSISRVEMYQNTSFQLLPGYIHVRDIDGDKWSYSIGEGDYHSVDGIEIRPNKGFYGILEIPVVVTDSHSFSAPRILEVWVKKGTSSVRETPKQKGSFYGLNFDLLGRRSLN